MSDEPKVTANRPQIVTSATPGTLADYQHERRLLLMAGPLLTDEARQRMAQIEVQIAILRAQG